MSQKRFINLLALSTVMTYVIIVVGATIAVTDIGSACQTWPTCNGELFVPLDNTPLAVAWGYRVFVIITALVIGVTTLVGLTSDIPGKVKYALVSSSVLYPVQIWIGALVVTGGPSIIPALHLLVAMVIFSGLLVALTWALESSEVPAEDNPSGIREEEKEAVSASENSQASPWTLRHKLKAYVSLTKPRLMWLLCLVALAGMGIAAGSNLKLMTVVATLTGGVLAIGASGTFNHVIERDIDRKMNRTSDRPLVENRIPVRNALAFGGLLTVASLTVFVLLVNVLAAVLGLIAILFYSVVYTVILKPHTKRNIVIGGAVGAMPALIGWAAVTEHIGLPAVVLGGVIFLWTPAHFYNLALAYKEDYARGGFPMLPVVKGEKVTRRHILLYLGATLLSAGVLGAVAPLGWIYAGTTVVVGALFIWAVMRLYHERTDEAALRSFYASNAYLGAVLIAIVVDTILL
ncbi:MAG: heme o synthase [Halobacteria archaeon]|nr:heme o synthase [Halobacteria archaeon]